AQVLTLKDQGRFRPVQTPIPSFPLGSHPVWMHLEVDNPTASGLARHLVVGMPWLEHVDVYVVRRGAVLAEWHTGTGTPQAQGLTPSRGFDVPYLFETGRSDVYFRVASVDPPVIPVRLMTEDQLDEMKSTSAYLMGGFYGFLIALCAYNLLLFMLV